MLILTRLQNLHHYGRSRYGHSSNEGETTRLQFAIPVPRGGKGLRVFIQQILLELRNIKSFILAHYILAFITLSCTTTDYELFKKNDEM